MNVALILSGGKGTRIKSDIPKQYLTVGGKPILMYCVKTLSSSKEIDAVQIVAEIVWQETILGWMEEYGGKEKFRGFSKPGKNRQLSIYHGLKDIRSYADEKDFVLIHDAARPGLTTRMIRGCFDMVSGHDGVTPVLPMKDTVYCSTDGKKIASLLKRDRLYAGQAPEIFRLGVYYEANKRLFPERIMKINGSAEPAVLVGMDIVLMSGDENNFKITTKEDLYRFQALVEKGKICQ